MLPLRMEKSPPANAKRPIRFTRGGERGVFRTVSPLPMTTYPWYAIKQNRVVPDFLIGAHALVEGYTLLARDRGYYRGYFNTLTVIEP